MKSTDDNKLDNPVWFSLSETHKTFAVEYGDIKFYQPDYCPFGGLQKHENVSQYIDEYSTIADNFFIVGEKPELSNKVKMKRDVVCLQMIIADKIDIEITEPVRKLKEVDADILYQLINLVQPGYFKKKTALLGDYFGIFINDELIAVTGERMKMDDYTEVSAVVTHPDHTGKGYAKQLLALTVNNIFDRNKTPYLHVVEDNIRAISLYEKSGFKTRRKISFWNVAKVD